jgi:hypothetical protein
MEKWLENNSPRAAEAKFKQNITQRMVFPCPDSWVEGCRSMFWKAQLHMVFELVTCTHGIQNTTSKNAVEKINLKCTIHKP